MFIFIVEENFIIWFYHQLFIHLIFDGYLMFFAVWRKSSYPPISLLRTDSHRQEALNCTPALLLITVGTVVVSIMPACDDSMPSIPITPAPNNTMHPYVLPWISVKNIMEIPKDAATSPLRHFPHCLGDMSILMEPLRNLLGCYIFSSYLINTFFISSFLFLIPSPIISWSSGAAPSDFHSSFKEPSKECPRISCREFKEGGWAQVLG